MRCRLGAVVALGLVLLGCDSGWLHERGLRVIREVSVGEGARLLEDPATVLIQVRSEDWTGVRVEGTKLVAETDPLPEDWGGPVLILAEEIEQGVRMAARLSRAGIQDVAVVRGGVAAWQAAHVPETPRNQPGAGEAT